MQVSLFFTESPTNPFLRCVDIKLVSELCHRNGALLCIDGTFATPLNQKALALGADLIMHSCTKYMGGHHDVSQPNIFFKTLLMKTDQIFYISVIHSILASKNTFFLFQVLGGCISGSNKLISELRTLHHILGGALNPVSNLYKPEPSIEILYTSFYSYTWNDIILGYCA